ncbi:MAG: hypothetical protein JWO78_409 [Micavibrio sp.]|nr:hypothetical protein [Micavibrio sp.]
MTRIILTMLFALLSFTAPAKAAIDAKGAAHLKTVFTQYLDDRKAAMKASRRELRTEGPLTVEPAGSYYAITMPHISLINADGTSTDVGIFAINALPGDRANEWKLTLASPTPITGYGIDKQPRFRTTIGGQTFNGIWNETIQTFTKLDAQYLNIVVNQIQDGIVIKVPKTTIIYNLTPSGDGKTWSGPLKYEMTDIQALRRGETTPSRIGRFSMAMNVRDFDPAQGTAYQKKIATLNTGKVTTEQLPGIYAAFFDFIGSSWSGFDSKITVDSIALAQPPDSGKPAGMINLGQAAVKFDMEGFKTGAVKSHLNVGYDGLSFKPPQPGMSDTVPAHLALDMVADKLPLKELTALAVKNILPETATPEAKRAAGMELARMIPELLTQAGTTVKVSDSSFGNATYNVLMNGLLNADVKSLYGARGKMKLEAKGVDQLLKAMQTQMKDPKLSAQAQAGLQKAYVVMMVVNGVGQQDKATGMRVYDLELTPEGKVMMNGQDLSLLIALAQAAAPKPKR